MVVDELDMSVEWKWHAETWSHRVIESLKRNNVEAGYAADRKEALAMVKKAIPKGATIGIGDSLTLHEIGLFDWLEKQPGKTVFNPFVKDAEGYNVYKPLERFEMMRKAMTSDVFLVSSNAVTLDGKLVNVDGRGNRVAAMIFGPKRTILVIGANKIVKDVDEALERIKSICAPVNARRHALKHHNEAFGKLPCAIQGYCGDCRGDAKMCRKTVIIDGMMKLPGLLPPGVCEMHVIMVGESLGI